MTENGKNVTWQWIAVTVVGVLIVVASAIMADTRNSLESSRQERQAAITDLQKTKLDKDQYYRDIGDIKQTLSEISKKIDKIDRGKP